MDLKEEKPETKDFEEIIKFNCETIWDHYKEVMDPKNLQNEVLSIIDICEEYFIEKMEEYAKVNNIDIHQLCECGNIIETEGHKLCLDCWKKGNLRR